MGAPGNGPRLLRGAAVATVVTVAMLAASRLPVPSPAGVAKNDSAALAAADPLVGELRRCQLSSQAAADDPACLRAWAENRRRFMAPGARPQAIIATGAR